MMWEPAIVIDHGHYQLPTEACHPGEFAVWNFSTEKYNCTPCPKGHHSTVQQTRLMENTTCIPCLDGFVAQRNSSSCQACENSTVPNTDKEECIPDSAMLITLAGSITGVGIALIVGSVASWYAWKATARLRALRRQFSNDNVAQECAEAIARLDLDAVKWLKEAKNPNKIQESFLQIVNILTEVRPFIPDNLLCALGSHVHESQEQQQSNTNTGEIVRSSNASPELPMLLGVLPSDSPKPEMTVDSEDSEMCVRQQRPLNRPAQPVHQGPRTLAALQHQPLDEWVRKRCVYMLVRFSFAPGGPKDALSRQVGDMLRNVVTIVKDNMATIDHATADTVAVHWGLAATTSEAPLKASLAALQISELRTALPVEWARLLQLSVAVTQGMCSSATVGAAQHRFFVVRGTPISQASHPTLAEAFVRCRCDVLVANNIQQQVQYRVEFMPRVVVDSSIFWQATGRRAPPAATDEWMYELQHMDSIHADRWAAPLLSKVFFMAIEGNSVVATLREAERLREKYGAEMSAADVACLEYLKEKINASPCKTAADGLSKTPVDAVIPTDL